MSRDGQAGVAARVHESENQRRESLNERSGAAVRTTHPRLGPARPLPANTQSPVGVAADEAAAHRSIRESELQHAAPAARQSPRDLERSHAHGVDPDFEQVAPCIAHDVDRAVVARPAPPTDPRVDDAQPDAESVQIVAEVNGAHGWEAAVGGRRSEVRGQKSEVRGQRSEVGGQNGETGFGGIEGGEKPKLDPELGGTGSMQAQNPCGPRRRRADTSEVLQFVDTSYESRFLTKRLL